MITVRYPTGIAVTYDSATFIEQSGQFVNIYDRKCGILFASVYVDAGTIIEWHKPCKIENTSQVQTLDSAAELVLSDLSRVKCRILSDLKLALEKFNRQTFRWKE